MTTRLQMVRGDTKQFRSPVTLSGAAVDLTGGKLIFTVKKALSDADVDAVAQKSWDAGTPHGITVTTPGNGIAITTIDPSDTAGLDAPVTLFWDLQYETTGAAQVYTVDSGTLLVTPDVTRST